MNYRLAELNLCHCCDVSNLLFTSDFQTISVSTHVIKPANKERKMKWKNAQK